VHLPRALYESLPAAYVALGIAGLVAGYVLHTGRLSTALSVGGLLIVIGGTMLWLRRRDYRATRADLLRNSGEDSQRRG
jgi:hypothetical protein